MAKESESVSTFDLCTDDVYLAALLDDNHEHEDAEILDVSDAKYADELQFQEAIMASLISSQIPKTTPPLQHTTPPIQHTTPSTSTSVNTRESTHSFCEICAEKKETHEMFSVDKCCHSFCSSCISRHVSIKLQDNVNIVNCPGFTCESVLEYDVCRQVISKDVIEQWDEALTKSLIACSEKFYCPFKDCSAMLVNDGGEVIREAECPECRRLFCAQCYVGWHSGVECEEFQRLNADERGREDLMVRELAKEKNWMRCPQCKFYVEKTDGCLHITCRCGFQFCYACGAIWTSTHGGCQAP